MENFKKIQNIGGRFIPMLDKVLLSGGALDLREGLCLSLTRTRGFWLCCKGQRDGELQKLGK